MPIPAVKALAEAQVAGTPPAALVDAGLLHRQLAGVPCHPIQLALTPALSVPLLGECQPEV